MARSRLARLLPGWLRDKTNRLLLGLGLALLAALASVVSFVLYGGGSGTPGRLEIGLLVFSMFATYYLAMQSSAG